MSRKTSVPKLLQNQCNLSWKPVVFVFKGNSKLILKFIWKCKVCKVAKTILGDNEKLDGGDYVIQQLGQAELHFPEFPSLRVSVWRHFFFVCEMGVGQKWIGRLVGRWAEVFCNWYTLSSCYWCVWLAWQQPGLHLLVLKQPLCPGPGAGCSLWLRTHISLRL